MRTSSGERRSATRVVVVDRRPKERAQVADAGGIGARRAEPNRFVLRGGGELGDEPGVDHDEARSLCEVEMLR
jgi:hypothetical protein